MTPAEKNLEAARAVDGAVRAAQAAIDAIQSALDTGGRVGVAVPGWQDLMNARTALYPVVHPQGAAVVLSRAEINAAQKRENIR